MNEKYLYRIRGIKSESRKTVEAFIAIYIVNILAEETQHPYDDIYTNEWLKTRDLVIRISLMYLYTCFSYTLSVDIIQYGEW